MPNRIIKESIRISKNVNSMSDFQFRLWIYLITYVDDYGRGSADAEILKGFLFPRRKRVTETDIAKGLNDLAGMGCILLYEIDGESYFCFPNWGNHQRIRNCREKFPAPPDNLPQVAASCGELPPRARVYEKPNPNPESQSESESKTCGTRFDEFWASYPKKVGKEAARKAFGKVHVPVDVLISAVEAQKMSAQWQKDHGQYIPNPATWLNQGRWEDELQGAAQGPQRRKTFSELIAEAEANEVYEPYGN